MSYQKSTELYHYGVLGMRWGHRKDRVSSGRQPVKDLSDEELKKYVSRKALEEKYNNYEGKRGNKLSAASDIANRAKDAHNNIEREVSDAFKTSRQAKKNSMDLSRMSDEELRKRVNRMNLERQYKDLTPVEISKGERITSNVMNIVGATLSTTAAALGIAVSIKSLMKK